VSNTKIISYIRVSSQDQNEARQVKKMLDKGVDKEDIYIDKASGKDFNRPEYQAMKRNIRKGDLVYIDALDRLGRNYDEIIKEWKWITREKDADIVILENETLFDSRKFKAAGDVGKLMEDQFLSLLSYVADQERKKIRTRQAEGIAVAKSQGKHLGRPQMKLNALSKEQRKTLEILYPQWKADQITAVKLMDELKLKKTTFYKIIKEYEENLA
jgi:DNA invertase Pin-like site-specific DNA recombinase